ncbi:MAG: VWA domain-containing protein, partial [Ruminococcus sp.]|nr:VWA domain-containing protein [Ruminococcus sp.]
DYYEQNVSFTDPLNPDCDGDGLLDGREIRAGLDPLSASTDGVTPDRDIIKDASVKGRLVTVDIKGLPQTATAAVNRLDNNSIQGTPGIVGEVYEFYSDRSFDSCDITFAYGGVDTSSREITESALSVFRFNSDKLTFEKLASSVNTENKSVTAQIQESGIYALCDTSILESKSETNIFFLIDNSGSMYPEELCANSEENDVEFKRLDFAVNLIDMLGVDANYGAGEFSGNYTIITPISNNYESVKQSISDIRNKNQIFSGTEIAGAILGAVNEFGEVNGADKNYIILLTDGMPSVYNAQTEQQAIDTAAENNITIFTIGLGKYIDSQYLFDIAEKTNGQFFQASNADALENIYEKIQNFMSYNQVIIEEESGKKGFIVADSGFNVLKDGIGYNNFRSDFAPNGADVGIAGLIRDYYTGDLSLSEQGYTTDDGKQIAGYDISGIELLTDGKADLNSVEISALKSYNEYLSRMDKWNYRSIKGGVLHYTDSTRDFIDGAGLKVITSPYEFEVPEQSGFMNFLRTITFNRIKPFEQYECVLIDSKSCEGEDLSVMNMLQWYSGLAFSEDKCDIYDFGYEGDAAFDALIGELTTGSPAVITYGGSAMNAVRIARDSNNPDLFVIDAYDSNSPERSTRITLSRTPVYDGENTPYYQYTASRGSVEQPLRIIISKK